MPEQGGQGGHCPLPPIFGRSINPIPNRGGIFCPPPLYYWHPKFFSPSVIAVTQWWSLSWNSTQLIKWANNCHKRKTIENLCWITTVSSKQQQQHLESSVAVVVSSYCTVDLKEKENNLARLGTKLNENFQRRMNFGDVST